MTLFPFQIIRATVERSNKNEMPDTKIIEFLCQKFEEFEWQALKGSKIVDFYQNKTIFVTGATGFFGKLLVEKLLRACPELDTIFILVRPKKGEDSNERIKKLYSLQVNIVCFLR